jgi:membrane protease YdiL (CAAX protease family)
MMLQQTRALLLLVFRHWTRRAMRPGDAPRRGFPTTFLLNLGALAYFMPLLWRNAQMVVASGDLRPLGTGVGLYGVALFAFANSLTLLMPEMGKLRPPLRHALLDDLPLSPFPVMLVTWLQGVGYLALTAVYLFGLSPELRASGGGIAYLVVLTLGLSLSAGAAGMAAVSLLRASVSAHQRRRLGWLHMVTLLGGIVAVMAAPTAADYARWLVHDPMRWVVAALLGEERVAALGLLFAVGAGGLLITSLCETRGYDRIDSAPPETVRGNGGVRTMDGVERLLFSREQGRRVLLFGMIIAGLAFIALARFARGKHIEMGFLAGMAVNLAYLPILMVLQFSSAMARRDVNARPLLSALPLAPHQTLDGKIAALRRYVFPATLLMLPLAWVAIPTGGLWLVSWHLAAFFAAVWLLCSAAVPVAFLTNGLGAPTGASLGSSGSFATTLLMFPVLSAVVARSPLDAAISLAMLAAISREARRAALRCVQWIDDAGDVERDTAVWRALLVLATFFAAQGLIARLLMILGVEGGYAMAAVYGLASIVLALLTFRQRQRLPPLRLLPARNGAMVLGVLAGCVSAILSLGLLKLLSRLGWSPGDDQGVSLRGGELLALLFVVVVLAPLAEETFFRGWLQGAIAGELPDRKWRAVIYASLGFAAMHLGTLYVPQLILGLLAGGLYFWSGGLLPGMLAHAVHNGLAALLAP